MTQMTRNEARIDVFSELRPEDRIVHIQDPWDGFTYAATADSIPELLKIDPNLIVMEY